jgi:putative transcriptional regulator
MLVNHLPYLMQQKGLSIRELSRQTGITYTTIRAVYHGDRRSVQLDVIDSICRILQVQPGDIYKYYQDESVAAEHLHDLSANQVSVQNARAGDSITEITTKNEEEVLNTWHVW